MELKEFVSETIVQITQGILDAQEQTKSTGILISPPLRTEKDGQYEINRRDKMNYILQTLHFDVSLSVESTTTGGGQGKASIAVFSASLGGKKESKDTNTSRISFDIPICWPSAGEIEGEDLSSVSCPVHHSSPW